MNEKLMKEAIKRARRALVIDEMPIGAVIVKDGHIIASGYNRRETKKNALLHAEIIAINRACKRLGGWRLTGCDMYVTLEPCPMCAGAAINARLDNVYFGAYDKNSGCAKSAVDLFSMNLLSHKINCEGGILEDECRGLLQSFFKKLRSR
ncbi:MAG: nucleoside deaminase [Clostridia bacterium]|nr:nucleoside deaminase [Clostridia bacterium]